MNTAGWPESVATAPTQAISRADPARLRENDFLGLLLEASACNPTSQRVYLAPPCGRDGNCRPTSGACLLSSVVCVVWGWGTPGAATSQMVVLDFNSG